MKRSKTVSTALVAAGILALAALVTHERNQSAQTFLQAIQKRFAAGEIGRDQLLRELALAQAQAEQEGKRELATRVQLERGRVLLDLGSFASARTELAAVSAEGGARAELELLRIELERRAGDPDAGLELAQAWLKAHPDDAQAWDLSGQLARMRSEVPRDEALQSCRAELLAANAARAAACVRELSARLPSDLQRVAEARELRELYGPRMEASAEHVLALCDRAAADAADARAFFARSLELRVDPGTLAELAELFEQAGLAEEALDLLTAATSRPELRENERATTFLLHALVGRERWGYARRVAEAWLKDHKGKPEFLLDACRAEFGALGGPAPDPDRLYSLSSALLQVRSAEMGAAPLFFMGTAYYHIGAGESISLARLVFTRYVLDTGPEPVPGARSQAFRLLAECCRKLGLAAEERGALESAAELDPAGSGELWLRLAELQLAAPRGGLRLPELRWARGMALLPARTSELLPRWLEIGADELRSIGLDLRNVQQDIRNGLNVRPSSGAAPYELYALARAEFEAGKLYETQLLLQELELAVPNFVPTLDLRIQLLQARGRTRDLVDAFLTRMELVGYDARSRELQAALPADALTPADLRRIVRADPELSGRMALARSLAARGERRSALQALLQIPAGQLGSAGQVFAARLELDSGSADAAFQRLGALGDELGSAPGALETWIAAGLRAGRAEDLRAQLAPRIAALTPDRARFLALADRLLTSGEARLAAGLLQRLDQAGKAFRGGELSWRLCACALALQAPDAFAQSIERAAAFDTRGEVELLQLLALPAEASPEDLQGAVLAVRKAGWRASPLGQAALALLAGEGPALSSALEAARLQAPGEPLVDWLAGAAPAGADARELAALALTLERPALGAVALARLGTSEEQAGSTWRAWIRARLYRQAGEREAEERVLRALLERDPRFVAAWDRLDALHADPDDEGQGDLDLRLARAQALGESSGTPAEREWLRSRELERQGALEDALAAARSAAADAPDSGPILHHLGRLALGLERLPLALEAYRRALPRLPASSHARSTLEFLELLESARGAEPPLLDAEAERSELERLAARAPDDPRVLLAQARNDLETSAVDPAFGAQRAAQRLEHFRGQHPGRSFESLAAGSTERWARFLLELEPPRARAFLEDELTRDPGNLAAWALLPSCSALQGRDAQALAELAFVERLAPGAESLAEFLRVRARRDWSATGIGEIAGRLRALDPQAAGTPAALADQLRAYLNLGQAGVDQALELGAQLPPARLAAQPRALRAEIFWMQAVALLARGTDDDRVQARLRTTVLGTLVHDPARQPLVLALRGLTRPPAAGAAPRSP